MAKSKDRALEPPRMTILSDHPILRVDEEEAHREPDSFTLHSRLGAVYDIIRHKNTRAALAIAVYGDWGTGKSSAMRWLSDQLGRWSKRTSKQRGEHYRTRTVWFDPWKYTKREDVWRGLIAEVILNTIDIHEASLPTVLNAARKFGLFLGRSFLNILSSAELTIGAKEIGGEAKVDLEALSKIAEDYRQTAHPEKAFLNEFETALREWVKDSLADDERMVIFIDDLDRCLPEVVLEVLEALKLYLNIPQIIFVVGLDSQVVESVVKHHYEKHGLGKAKAKHYLDKMFQVEVDIPPSQKLMEGYIEHQIAAMNDAADGYWSDKLTGWNESYKKIVENKIGTLADDNPREIKRLLNSTLLRGTAAALDDALGDNEAQRFTQGCQVYLIQRVLQRYVPESTGLMRRQRVLEFFQDWSGIRQLHPDFRPGRQLTKEESPDDDMGQPRSRKSGDGIADKAYEPLRAKLPLYRDTGEVVPLLDQPDLWDLLAIPFSAQVAAAAVIDSSESEAVESVAAATVAASARVVASAKATARATVVPAPKPGPTAADEAPATEPATVDLASMPRAVLSAIARSLKKPVGKLQPDDLRNVTELDLSDTGLDDLALLAGLSGLQELYLDGTQVSDLTPLAGLSGLQKLYLRNTQVSDLTPVAGLSGLQTLFLGDIQVSDLAPLEGLSGLQTLSLSLCSQVSDFTPLAGLTGLQVLDLEFTSFADLTPLAALSGLQTLSLAYTQFSDLALLAALLELRTLSLDHTPVSDLAPLAGLTELRELDLRGTRVSDLTPLVGLSGLRKLDIGNTKITDVSPLKHIKGLEIYGP